MSKSDTMQKFIKSGVPQFGGEKPFAVTHHSYYVDDMEFEASEWWDTEEHMTIGVVLTDAKYLLRAMMAMHEYIIEQWDEAVSDFRKKKPQTPAREYISDNGTKRTIKEYYAIDSVQSFRYCMALIMPATVAKKIEQYAIPEDLEIYVVSPFGNVGIMLPGHGDESEKSE